MTQQLPANPALLLVDIQQGFDEPEFFGGTRNNPGAEANAQRLLEHWRKQKWPLFHIRHCSIQKGSPLAEGHPGNAHKAAVKPLPGEPIIKKHANSAFIGTDLKDRLDAAGINTVIVVGLTTSYCVSTTARMAGNYGYRTIVVSDATAAFRVAGIHGEEYTAEQVHLLSLATLKDEFAEICTTTDLITS